MRYSKGIMWLDDCRIPFVDEVRTIPVHCDDKKTDDTLFGLHPTIQHKREITTQGRFTTNLLVCDDVLNDGCVTEAKANLNYKWNNTIGGGDIFSNRGTYTPRNDKGSNSRYYDLDKWFEIMLESL